MSLDNVTSPAYGCTSVMDLPMQFLPCNLGGCVFNPNHSASLYFPIFSNRLTREKIERKLDASAKRDTGREREGASTLFRMLCSTYMLHTYTHFACCFSRVLLLRISIFSNLASWVVWWTVNR